MSYHPIPGFEHVQPKFHSDLPWILAGKFETVSPMPLPVFRDVLRQIYLATGVTREQILGEGIARPIATARALAILIGKKANPDWSHRDLSRFINREESNAHHAFRRATKRLQEDRAFRLLFERVNGALGYPCDG